MVDNSLMWILIHGTDATEVLSIVAWLIAITAGAGFLICTSVLLVLQTGGVPVHSG